MFDNCHQFLAVKVLEGQVVNVIVRLIDKGYADRILLSQDTCKMAQFRIHGAPGFTYVGEKFLHLLRSVGVPEVTITKITHVNSARWLEVPGLGTVA